MEARLTDPDLLAELMRKIFNVFNEYNLEQGDVTTLLAHLQFYNQTKFGKH